MISSKTGTARRSVTCDDHAGYAAVLYCKQVYHVNHVLPLVVYAPVYALANMHLTKKDLRECKSFSFIK